MNDVQTFLINLPDSTDRLTSATAQLDREGVPFTVVPAVDGRGKTADMVGPYDAARCRRLMGRDMSGGEAGCFMSHRRAAQAFLDGDAPFGLVLEDDMSIPTGFAEACDHLLAQLAPLSQHWDVINIGANRIKLCRPVSRVRAGDLDATLYHAHYFPMTTTGLIWTRDGARAFLQTADQLWAPVDNALREWQTRTDRGLAVYPPLVSVTGIESDIDAGPAKRRKQDRSPFYGLIKQRRLWANKLIAWRHLRRPSPFADIQSDI